MKGRSPYSISKLIIGLGNPGGAYDKTKHNVGKNFIDYVMKKNAAQTTSFKNIGDIAYLRQKTQPKHIALFKPTSFMNLSGTPVKAAIKFCGLEGVKDIIVVTDNLEQDFGKYRIKDGGSAMGHNGVKSIIEGQGGAKEFKRLLIGIGRPSSNDEDAVSNYVLSRFDANSLRELELSIFPKAFEFLVKEMKLDL